MAKYIPDNNIIGTNLVPNDINVADDLSVGGDLTLGDDLLFGSSGCIVSFNGGDVTLTHSSALLTLQGGGLTMTEDLTLGKNLNIATDIIHVGDTNNKIGFTTDTQTFTTGGSARLTINDSGSTFAGNVTAPNVIIDDDGQIGSASANSAMEIDDQGVVGFNGGITAAGNVKSTIKTRVAAITNSTDGDYKMGDVVYFGSTTSMTVGSIYVYSGTAWELANAGAASTAIGMLAVALGSASDTNGMLLRGMVTLSADPGSVSEPLYLSTTGGRAQNSAPTGSGKVVRLIGYCLNSTNGQVYFNPDNHHAVL